LCLPLNYWAARKIDSWDVLVFRIYKHDEAPENNQNGYELEKYATSNNQGGYRNGQPDQHVDEILANYNARENGGDDKIELLSSKNH